MPIATPLQVDTLPPAERERHDAVGLEPRAKIDPDTGKVTGYVQGARVKTRTEIERLALKGKLSLEQARAARWLYWMFFHGGLSPVVTICLAKVHNGGGGSRELSDDQLDSRTEFNQAMLAIPAELTDLVYDVVCADKSLPEISFSRGWGKTTKALALLRVALDDLWRHVEQRNRARSVGSTNRSERLHGAELPPGSGKAS